MYLQGYQTEETGFTPPKNIINRVINNSNKKDKKMEKNKKMEIYKNLILDVPGVKTAKFEKSIESSVTTSWGVNWDADFIARDILQNFRDSNLSEIEKVVVNTKNDRILVEGNNCFDLRKLFFVGSNKAGDETTVGEYGEGFKAAVVSMLKEAYKLQYLFQLIQL